VFRIGLEPQETTEVLTIMKTLKDFGWFAITNHLEHFVNFAEIHFFTFQVCIHFRLCLVELLFAMKSFDNSYL